MQLNEDFGSEYKTALKLITLCTGLIFYTCRSGFSTGTSIFKVLGGKNQSSTETAVLPLSADGQRRNA